MSSSSFDPLPEELELVLDAHARDLGGVTVRRALPSLHRRLIGPFIFYDHVGPVEFGPGQGLDVRPHPHIGLATVTYLFAGEFLHRDSLGSRERVQPGDVNWMISGRGIVHSERTPAELRERGVLTHGIQCWVALPLEHEDMEPSFEHHPAASLPTVGFPGAEVTVILGMAYGEVSPVRVLSPTLYCHAGLQADAAFEIDETHAERAVYVAVGNVRIAGRDFREGALVVLREGAHVSVRATEPSRVMLLGGAKLKGERLIEWNFVASTQERIDKAKDDWRAGRFPKVPDDELEFIPLPEERG